MPFNFQTMPLTSISNHVNWSFKGSFALLMEKIFQCLTFPVFSWLFPFQLVLCCYTSHTSTLTRVPWLWLTATHPLGTLSRSFHLLCPICGFCFKYMLKHHLIRELSPDHPYKMFISTTLLHLPPSDICVVVRCLALSTTTQAPWSQRSLKTWIWFPRAHIKLSPRLPTHL